MNVGPRPRRARILGGALLCWAAAVLWLSSLTPEELPSGAFLFGDKINHVALFAVGGWLAAAAVAAARPGLPAVAVVTIAVVGIAAFGVLDETVQTLTPGRTGGDLRDWAADVAGAVLGAALSLLSRRRICRRGRRLV